jgi:hypothetical protein
MTMTNVTKPVRRPTITLALPILLADIGFEVLSR